MGDRAALSRDQVRLRSRQDRKYGTPVLSGSAAPDSVPTFARRSDAVTAGPSAGQLLDQQGVRRAATSAAAVPVEKSRPSHLGLESKPISEYMPPEWRCQQTAEAHAGATCRRPEQTLVRPDPDDQLIVAEHLDVGRVGGQVRRA
jgi:hypothetical protein